MNKTAVGQPYRDVTKLSSGCCLLDDAEGVKARKKIILSANLFCSCKSKEAESSITNCSRRCGCRKKGSKCLPGCECGNKCLNKGETGNLGSSETMAIGGDNMHNNHTDLVEPVHLRDSGNTDNAGPNLASTKEMDREYSRVVYESQELEGFDDEWYSWDDVSSFEASNSSRTSDSCSEYSKSGDESFDVDDFMV